MRGGLRTRLILDSVRVMIVRGLLQLGWFDATVSDTPPGTRQHRPVNFVPRPNNWDEPIEPNAIAISIETILEQDQGMGDDVEDMIAIYVDVFAESDELGWQLAHEVRDLLIGKLPDVGPQNDRIDVFDLRLDPPQRFTQVTVDTALMDRAQAIAAGWQKHWVMVRCEINDEYLDEYDDFGTSTEYPLAGWDTAYQDAWVKVRGALN